MSDSDLRAGSCCLLLTVVRPPELWPEGLVLSDETALPLVLLNSVKETRSTFVIGFSC
jgi:hypothetical protein